MTRVNDRTVSKSARKREHLRRQALGENLIALPLADLEAMDLDESLFRAIVDAKSIASREASRRQRQLIGKLMRDADAERIAAKVDALRRGDRLATAVFHSAEEWRERICMEGAPALAELTRLTGGDNPAFAGLLHEYETAGAEPVRRAVRRRLFREVHRELQRIANENGTRE